MAKKKKQEKRKSWCWYCDREFEDEKILVVHQRMKHFQCNICHRKLNSASGLVIHMAQVHKETMEKVPNAVDGHDSPEVEIYGMDGVPQEDVQRHYDGLPLVPYTKGKLIIGDSSILPILAAQKASVAMLLAESKNMTVQGDSGTGNGNPDYPSSSAAAAAVQVGSSAMSVVSPPLPSSNTGNTANTANTVNMSSNQPQYWPYVMPPEHAASYAQYYQAYYAQGSNQAYYPSPETVPLSPVIYQSPETETVSILSPESQHSDNEPFVIQPHVDPATNKAIPGTIFTVPSLDRSLEELRSELKKYKNKK